MSLSTVLTFNYSGGTEIGFYDRDVWEIVVTTHQDTILRHLQDGAPRLIKKGVEWDEMVVSLKPNILDIPVDVNTLRQVTSVLTVQLLYTNGTVADTYGMKIDPNVDFNYWAGYKDTKLIKMKLYETIGEFGEIAATVGVNIGYGVV